MRCVHGDLGEDRLRERRAKYHLCRAGRDRAVNENDAGDGIRTELLDVCGHVLSALGPADQDIARHAQAFERVMQVARPSFGCVVVCGTRRLPLRTGINGEHARDARKPLQLLAPQPCWQPPAGDQDEGWRLRLASRLQVVDPDAQLGGGKPITHAGPLPQRRSTRCQTRTEGQGNDGGTRCRRHVRPPEETLASATGSGSARRPRPSNTHDLPPSVPSESAWRWPNVCAGTPGSSRSSQTTSWGLLFVVLV